MAIQVPYHLLVGSARTCETCATPTRYPVYAYLGTDPTHAVDIGTWCGGCQPVDQQENT